MEEEDEETAARTLRGACVRLTPQQWYNQKHTAIGHFFSEKGERKLKVHNVKMPPEMTMQDYMSVSKLSMRFYTAAKLPLDYLFLN